MKNYRIILTLFILLLSQLANGQSTLPEKSKQAKVYLESRSDIAKEALKQLGIDSLVIDKEEGGFYDVGYRFEIHGRETLISQPSSYGFFTITTSFKGAGLTLEDANRFNQVPKGTLSISLFGRGKKTAYLTRDISFSGGITMKNVINQLKYHSLYVSDVNALIEKSR